MGGDSGHKLVCPVISQQFRDLLMLSKVYINIHGLTAEQAEYNQYAPILMTSVDTDPALCAQIRRAILQRLGVGSWKIFGAHGAPKDHTVK